MRIMRRDEEGGEEKQKLVQVVDGGGVRTELLDASQDDVTQL